MIQQSHFTSKENEISILKSYLCSHVPAVWFTTAIYGNNLSVHPWMNRQRKPQVFFKKVHLCGVPTQAPTQP